MKFKMPPNSLFSILLRSPWWISLAIGAVIVAGARAALPPAYWLAGAMGATPFFVIMAMAAWRQWRAPSPAQQAKTLSAVSNMPWRTFADALEGAFRQSGHSVERLSTPAADFCFTKSGRTTLMSAKRWKAASHGVEPLRELQALRASKEANSAIYIAMGSLTPQAQQFARQAGIQLVQADGLATLLRHTA